LIFGALFDFFYHFKDYWLLHVTMGLIFNNTDNVRLT